jgi:hypothetical protein
MAGHPRQPQRPVGSGWKVEQPSLEPLLTPDYRRWTPLVGSALKVFEYITQGGKAVTLGAIEGERSHEIEIEKDHVGTTHTLLTLNGTVIDAADHRWHMTALSREPFKGGGSVKFRAPTIWIESAAAEGSLDRREGTSATVQVDLFDDPSDPYSATVGMWDSRVVGRSQRLSNGPSE